MRITLYTVIRYLVVLMISWASQAAAAPFVFTFDGATETFGGAAGVNFPSTPGGFSVNVKAYTGDGSTWTQLVDPTAPTDNLGVRRVTPGTLGVDRGGTDPNPGQIDSNLALFEGLLFDFGTNQWSGMTIDFADLLATDQLDIWIGNVFNAASPDPLATHVVSNATVTDPFQIPNFGGSKFLFVAAANDGAATGCATTSASPANCFQIDSLTAVPQPATLVLLGMAILLLASTRQRKSIVEKLYRR